MNNLLGKIVKLSIYLLVFLLPIFFLPFSFEAFDFNKQYLLFFLTSVGLLAWLSKMIFVDKEVRFKKTPLDIPVLVFLGVAVLSAIFSVDKYFSLFGFYGRFSNGLINLLCFGALYFLITNNVSLRSEVNGDKKTTKDQSKPISVDGLVKVFLWSVFFVVVTAYFSITGFFQKIPHLNFSRTFNPISGSLEGLAVFLSAVMVLMVGRFCCLKRKSGVKQAFVWGFLFSILVLLMVIDFDLAWIILLISLGLFLILSLITRVFRKDVNRLLLPIFLIIISSGFLFINANQITRLFLPHEVLLDQSTTWKASWGAATESAKSGFLGSGIGTWYYDFSKFKPKEFNETPWWQIRFDRGASYISEILGTTGFLGLLSYLFLAGMFLLVSWFLLKKLDALPYIFTIVILFLSQFVYYQNTVLLFAFWLFLGLAVVSWEKPVMEKVYSFKEFPELSLVFSTILILFILGVVTCYYFGARFYLADVKYNQSQLMPQSEERVRVLENAVRLNPYQPTYQVVLGRVYLFQILQEIGKPVEQQDAQKIGILINNAVTTGKMATQVSPNYVSSWETLGMIYRDIRFLVKGSSQDWAIKSFNKAIELEPKNPVLYTELGKLYLDSDVEKAKEEFAKGRELKSNYIDAQMQSALIAEKENHLDEAIKIMEGVEKSYPLNVDVLFQLGRLYFNANQIEKAISKLETAVLLMPNHSNALYSLGLSYEKKGEIKKAINIFEKVSQLNPGNQDIKNKLNQLKGIKTEKEEEKETEK